MITARDVASVYECPLVFAGRVSTKSRCACCASAAPGRAIWRAGPPCCDRMQHPRDEVSIGLVGKYVEYEDSYKSLKEALLHGGLAHQ